MKKKQLRGVSNYHSKQGKKIWEIADGYQCSVVGTCLHDSELIKIAYKNGLYELTSASSFELHNRFVQLTMIKCAESEAIHVLLMKKFGVIVNRFYRVRDDDTLRSMWRESVETGDVAGAYWAMVSHPRASSTVIGECYGEVHMLSHQSVLAEAIQKKNIAQLQQKVRTAEEATRQVQRRSQLKEEELLKRIAELEAQLEQKKDHLLRQRVQQKILPQEEQGYTVLCNRLQSFSEENDKLQLKITALAEENSFYKAQQRQMEDQQKQLETLFLQAEECRCCPQADTADCLGPELCGKTVLYVGGMHKMIPHYKSLVEKRGASFLHHDGGKEESKNRLPQLLVQADAVVCPIDCVSHDACLTVKRMCKQYEKPYVMMRSSGISSLMNSLENLALSS